MNQTAYDTVMLFPTLELRRRQEEAKLYHKCISRFNGHNLVFAYKIWNESRPKTHLNYISLIDKLSTLSRGCIHEAEAGVEPDSHPIPNIPPMQIAMMPQSNKSPFAIFNEPTSDEILSSLDCIVIE
ncbi:hypothetical protein RFI_39001, partial [Reticulomyxa filosa]